MVSTIIITEQWESGTNRKMQYLVYFISNVLSDSKTQYFHIMKLTYTLLITSCNFPITFWYIRLKFTLH
jgi:hypothetical protein